MYSSYCIHTIRQDICQIIVSKVTNHYPGCPRSGKKSGKKYFFNVRELSVNFIKLSRNSEIKQNVREKSGNLEIKSLGKVRDF